MTKGDEAVTRGRAEDEGSLGEDPVRTPPPADAVRDETAPIPIPKVEREPTRGEVVRWWLGRVVSPRAWLVFFSILRGIAGDIARRRLEDGLTVAVDINALWESPTGVGWYLHRLLEELADRPGLRLRLYGPAMIGGSKENPPAVTLPAGRAIEHVSFFLDERSAISHNWLREKLNDWERWLVAADGNRIVFAPNFILPKRLQRARGTVVATIHDLGVRKVRWTLRPETRELLEEHLGDILRRAGQLLTDAEAVRQELIELEGVEPWRLTSIHLGPGLIGTEEPGELPSEVPSRFALFVGTLEPRKNLPCLLEAWAEMRSRGAAPPDLVVAGKLGWKMSRQRRQLERARDDGWLRVLGYVPVPQLIALYHAAEVVVLPSWYEGFGLPVVEAFAAGKPVVLADIPVLREVGGEAALYASPNDPKAWADRLIELSENPELREALQAKSSERFAAFDWSRTADQTLAAWRRTAAGS